MKKMKQTPLFQIGKPKTAFLFVLFFHATQALAVENGQIFHEIRKPGIESNYILGLGHHIMLDENSLPPEINAAIHNSQTGLIELNREEQKRLPEAVKTTALFLPEGETLSLYLGEKKAREVFEFLQSGLAHNTGEDSVVNKLKTLYGIDITSYETVNHLIPYWITKLETLAGLPETLNYHFLAYPLPDCLSKNAKPMDPFIENTLICKGKPVYSIETVEIHTRAAYFNRNHYEEAQALHTALKKTDQKAKFNQSEMDTIIEEWGILYARILQRLRLHIVNHIVQNIPIDTHPETEQILDFLNNRHCADVPTNQVKEYIELNLQLYQLSVHYIIETQAEEETVKKNIAPIAERLYETGTVLFTSCFPDYIPEMSKEEAVELRTSTMWLSIQYHREQFNARDEKQALFLLPYLEEGGVFAAVGAGHLKGVLARLEARGWQVRAVPLSHPIREAQSNELDISGVNLSELASRLRNRMSTESRGAFPDYNQVVSDLEKTKQENEHLNKALGELTVEKQILQPANEVLKTRQIRQMFLSPKKSLKR